MKDVHMLSSNWEVWDSNTPSMLEVGGVDRVRLPNLEKSLLMAVTVLVKG